MKRNSITILILALCMTISAEPTYLTLQGCRDLALQSNTQTQIDKENLAAAQDLRKAALARFFPQFSANGAYVWNQKNLYLLPDQYQFTYGQINPDGTFSFNPEAFSEFPLDYEMLHRLVPDLENQVAEWVEQEYASARELSELDIHHIFVAQVGVTQPIFLGGKVAQLYKIAKANENIENILSSKNNDQLIVSVDEAYWRVISVQQKQKLAENYCNMLRKLVSDLTISYEEGTSTQADLLSVKVKLNEAEVSLMKAENGLVLSKMALCQLIGLDLNTDIQLNDENLDNVSLQTLQSPNMDEIFEKRQELQLLQEAEDIAKAGVKLTASTLMPNIVASANYITTNPNLFNGIHDNHNFKGMFTAGVVVNIPIAHAEDILQVKAAKHKARTIELQLQEAQEKISLQTTQTQQQLAEANRKLVMATANIHNAEENLRMAQAAFDEGMLTSTELLGAQTAWLKAYSEKIDAAIDVRLYEVYLQQRTGNLKY